jgi:hypothetical protein
MPETPKHVDLNPMAGQQEFSTRYHLAQHLEVFVPKGERSWRNLQGWLHEFVKETQHIKIADRGRWKGVCREDPTLNKRFGQKLFWENLVYGYSVYPADGYFVSAKDGPGRTSYREQVCIESISVIKFIITNYIDFSEREANEWSLMQTLERKGDSEGVPIDKGYTLLPTFASSFDEAPRFDDPAYFTRRCTALHYHYLSDYISTNIRDIVLHDEQEVWAHRWYTTLLRNIKRTKDGTKNSERVRIRPVAMSTTEREDRFRDDRDKVICVSDYERDAIGPLGRKPTKHPRESL